MLFYDDQTISFSEKIGVQKLTTWQLLSGRNKAIIEFIMKVLYCYPDVDIYWLLMLSRNSLAIQKN